MLVALARPPDRSIGSWPMLFMNQPVSRPRSPRPENSSALAGNVSLRLIIAGTRNVSPAEMWLLTRIAGPVSGRFSSPSIQGRNSSRVSGPIENHLKNQ